MIHWDDIVIGSIVSVEFVVNGHGFAIVIGVVNDGTWFCGIVMEKNNGKKNVIIDFVDGETKTERVVAGTWRRL
jgi:hypothetical protein